MGEGTLHIQPSREGLNPSSLNTGEQSPEKAKFVSKDITTLPDELVVIILSNLNPKSLAICQRVNRRWQGLITNHMLARSFYRHCHPSGQRNNPLTIERYHSSIRDWLRGFSNLGRESVVQLDEVSQHKHFHELLFFSMAKVLAEARELTCQNAGTIEHSNSLRDASFSSDGNHLVSVCFDEIKISGPVDGRWQEKVAVPRSGYVRKASFSPDGNRVVTTCGNRAAKIWEFADGEWQKKATIEHSVQVNNACFSPDGRHLVTFSDRCAAKIWELEGGEWQKKATIRHPCSVDNAYFSPDGNHLVTTAFRNKSTKICGLVNGHWQEEASIEHSDQAPFVYSGWVRDASFSPDGKYLATASNDGTAKIWKIVDGHWKETATIEHTAIVANVCFSPDGNYLLTIPLDCTVKIWKFVDGQCQNKATIRHSKRVEKACFSPDGNHVVTVSYDHTAQIWGLVDGRWLKKVTIQHSGIVRDASFSPDGKHLVTASDDYTAQIWGPVGGQWQKKASIGHPDSVYCVSFSPDGTHLVTATSAGIRCNRIIKAEVTIWMLKNKENGDDF